MRILAVAFACMMLMVGCSSTYLVGAKDSGADYDFEELNRRIEKRECTVVFVSGEEKKVKELISAKDSVSWIALSRISAPVSQISQVQRFFGESKAVITFANGERKIAEGVIITHDSVSWMETTRFWVPTSSIEAIRIKNAGAGAIKGLLPGALVGLSTGLIILGELNKALGGSTIPAQGYLILGGGGAAGGALLGALVGAIDGHVEEFRLHER